MIQYIIISMAYRQNLLYSGRAKLAGPVSSCFAKLS